VNIENLVLLALLDAAHTAVAESEDENAVALLLMAKRLIVDPGSVFKGIESQVPPLSGAKRK
jgi:hypothetical protein